MGYGANMPLSFFLAGNYAPKSQTFYKWVNFAMSCVRDVNFTLIFFIEIYLMWDDKMIDVKFHICI